jgi:hypothetical protein
MLNFNNSTKINPKISKYIKEQTNKSLEKHLNTQNIKFANIKDINIPYILLTKTI